MKPALTIVLTLVTGIAAFAHVVQGDDVAKIPGRENPVLKNILIRGLRIEGRWIGVIRRGFEEHTLTIEKAPDETGDYRLKFYSWTDTGGTKKGARTGKLVDGVLTLNEPIEGFGISKSPFNVLYSVRADGKEFLLPSVNAEELKAVDDVQPRIAYQFQRRTTR